MVDDILFTGPEEQLRSLITDIQAKYELRTVVYGPGSFLFFGLTILQDGEFNIKIHFDNKLEQLETFPIDLDKRKQVEMKLNDIETKSFESISSSMKWIRMGYSASLFCSLYSSYLQQRAQSPTVQCLVMQINCIRFLAKLGSSITFTRPGDKNGYQPSFIMFSDACRSKDNGKLVYATRLLICDFKKGSVYQSLSWTSSKSKRPVNFYHGHHVSQSDQLNQLEQRRPGQ